jgi:hypothetical protein
MFLGVSILPTREQDSTKNCMGPAERRMVADTFRCHQHLLRQLARQFEIARFHSRIASGPPNSTSRDFVAFAMFDYLTSDHL